MQDRAAVEPASCVRCRALTLKTPPRSNPNAFTLSSPPLGRAHTITLSPDVVAAAKKLAQDA